MLLHDKTYQVVGVLGDDTDPLVWIFIDLLLHLIIIDLLMFRTIAEHGSAWCQRDLGDPALLPVSVRVGRLDRSVCNRTRIGWTLDGWIRAWLTTVWSLTG